MPFWVVLDACVLFPISLCDTLLCIAETELYQPLWSEDILRELEGAVTDRRPGANIKRRIENMTEAFPEAMVSGYKPLVAAMTNRRFGFQRGSTVASRSQFGRPA